VWGAWCVWGVWGVCRGVWGVWGSCPLITFDIPQTALVATLDTYDFRSNSLHSYSLISNLTPLPATQNPAIKLFPPTENIHSFILS
jgi:hypothetical protein